MKTYTKEEVIALVMVAGARLVEKTNPSLALMVMGIQAELVKELDARELAEKEGQKDA